MKDDKLQFTRGDETKIPCRHCENAVKGKILGGYCAAFPHGKGKPDEVYFDNAPCEKFVQGEDLLPFELQV